jgi:hypothetical protein
VVNVSDSDDGEGKGKGDNTNQKKIFREPPHFTFDNYVADNKILNLLCGRGFDANRIPVCCAYS